MDFDELERLTQLVQNANISELTLRQGASRVTIRKNATPAVTGNALVPVTEEVSDEEDDRIEDDVFPAELREETPATITAPSVGFFHHIKPVVGLNAHVRPGQVVGVIEAMKVSSEVTSEYEGVVTDVLVEDGMPVQYGQPLFTIG